MNDITITIHGGGRTHGANGRFVRKTPVSHVCQVCGITFAHKRGGTANKACNRTCGFELRRRQQLKPKLHDHPPMPKTCSVCSGMFLSPQPNARMCSQRCRTEDQQRRENPERYSKTECSECGKMYLPTYGDWLRQCSLECSESALRKRKRKARKSRKNTEAWKAQRRKHRAKRDALKRSHPLSIPIDSLDPFVVFERDGWRCRQCKCSTPKELRGLHVDASPELDHAIPLSKGGPHNYANTQTLCRKCNALKSDGLYISQSA